MMNQQQSSNTTNKIEISSKSTQIQSLSNVPAIPETQTQEKKFNYFTRPNMYQLETETKPIKPVVPIYQQDIVKKETVKEFRMDFFKFSLGVSWLGRLFYLQTTKLMYLINKNVISKGKKIDIIHIPELEDDQKVEFRYSEMDKKLTQITQGKEIIGSHVRTMITSIFKKDLILSHILIALSLLIKTFYSMVIQQLINSIVDDDKGNAVFWVIILFILLVISTLLNNNSFNFVQSMSNQIRANLVAFLYTKASQLTSHQIQKANIGKLFNIISYDLSTFEVLTYFAFMLLYVPLLLLVSAVILYFRFGGYGLLSILIVFTILPIQIFLGMKQKGFTQMKNKYSDERIKLVTESIDGIRLIKMYGWEEGFRRFIQDVRDKEQESIRSIQLRRAFDRSMSMTIVILATFIPILIIYYAGDSSEITSSKIFATLEQIYGLRAILFLSGMGIGFFFQLSLIMTRFADFLKLKRQAMTQLVPNEKHNPELFEKQLELQKKKEQLEKKKMLYLKQNPTNGNNQQTMEEFKLSQEEEDIIAKSNDKYNQIDYSIQIPQSEENAIELQNFSCFWSVINPPTLKSVNLNIKKGLHYGIVGKVGSGKSTLLQVLLEEIPHLQGGFRKQGSLSYVEQEPYVFSGRFKDNILFGKPYEQEFYNQVIQACCLTEDLEQLPNGDDTEIGERGVNLSGGQKARLSLARAVYSRSDILLLDDPLSAVDSKVARKLNQNCINGMLKDKTLILVTHQIHYTKQCDQVIIFEDGKIIQSGKFEDITEALSVLSNQKITGDNTDIQSVNQNEEKNENPQVQENQKQPLDLQQKMQIAKAKYEKGQLFKMEKEEKFELSFQTYKNYVSAMNSKFSVTVMAVLYLATEGLYSTYYYVFGSYDEQHDKDRLFYISGIVAACFIVGCLCKYCLTVILAVRASSNLHDKMFKAITRTPQLYFDQTPTGRILTKFTSDIGAIDMFLPFMLFDTIEQPLQFINVCVTVGVFNPWFFILAAVLVICTLYLLKKNKKVIVESKQADLMFKSPVNSHFVKTIQGVIHVRVYKQVENFLKQMFRVVNYSVRTNICLWSFNRAFSFNLQFLTSLFSVGGIFLTIYTTTDSSKVGQIIVYLTMIVDIISGISRTVPNLENSMTSVERILQICALPQEDPLILPSDSSLQVQTSTKKIQQSSNTLPNNNNCKSWIKEGSVNFDNVQLRYRQDLDLVLKGTTFQIKGGERIGCIGRTGAGKSSILQALFRMVSYEQNSKITIDNHEITKMGLHTLRNSISIIPQIPFVFSGSIRRNLDPLEEYSDTQIWEALKQTDLEETIKKLPKALLTDMSNAQSVFSTGQKQLICLARAILKKSQILVLDEATANVDMRTDEFIQNAIKEQFPNSTIFTIAHRLNTIADYDKVIVMSDGVVAEMNSPFKLLVKNETDSEITSNSIFAQMVKNTGEQNSSHIFAAAKAASEKNQIH